MRALLIREFDRVWAKGGGRSYPGGLELGAEFVRQGGGDRRHARVIL